VAIMPKIKVALIGVGNCASALVQGLQNYCKSEEKEQNFRGLRHPILGGLLPTDVEIVAAFDVDARKVGKDLAEAIFAKPNNTPKIANVSQTGVLVQKGSLFDGVGKSAKNLVQISELADSDVFNVLKQSGTEIVVNLLPSGASEATTFYAEKALAAGCAFVNTTPNFLASDPKWAKKFADAGIPIVGDDLVDQVGSTALHRTLLQLLSRNGVKITETYQLDVGGGTESLDTMERTRDIKRSIKTESVAATLPYKTEVVAGSTDYVDFLENKRDSYFWICGTYFCNAPMQIDLKFSTIDAPNAGSVLLDVIRALKLALAKRQKGAIESICAYAFKHPPRTFSLEVAEEALKQFVKENS
jgi:myo-inositol-1-phosphate synthase